MPGNIWPESWLVSTAMSYLGDICTVLNCVEDNLQDALEYGLQAGKHNEVFEISRHLGLDKSQCLQALSLAVAMNKPDELTDTTSFIEAFLGKGS